MEQVTQDEYLERGYNSEELDRMYDEAETVDQPLFAEMRSNLLLVAGEHYNKKKLERFNSRLRKANVSEEAKLRLTKNHVHRISRLYINNLLTHSPNVAILPQIENEIQDQKAAELNGAVWRDACSKYKLQAKIRDWAQDFQDIGEVATVIKWNPGKGVFKGYEQLTDELGMPVFDEMGQPVPDQSSPVFSGAFEFERVFGFNLLRPPQCKDMDEAEYLIVRKMADTRDLKKMYAHDETKLKLLEQNEDETYLVFDGNRTEYTKTKGQTLIMEFYFRPCLRYPEGYFFIKTKGGILEEGPLPFGVFPLAYKGYEKLQTSPRCYSHIRNLRPYQIEINRAASAMATQQVTLGDDKLITNSSGKIEQGGVLPGVRVVKVPGGGNIDILPGRSGEQYLNYMLSQIKEMYDISNLAEEAQDKEIANGDPFNMLYRSLKQKKKFSLYIEKFEEFLVEVCEIYLSLAKHYLPDDELIFAIGKREAINIAEFRSTERNCYRIKVEPQTTDPITQFGKQAILNHTLQYVGNQLDKDDIGKILRNMPYANLEESFDDLTIDYDNARNDILALERGEFPQPNPNDNHKYIIKKLTHRMKCRDFSSLDPQIQQMFQQKLQLHQQIDAEQQLQIQMAQSGFIPTGGYLVKCDFYMPDKETGASRRAEIPYESLQWLIKKLEQQGMSQQDYQTMGQAAQAGVAEQFNQMAQMQQQQQMVPQLGV